MEYQNRFEELLRAALRVKGLPENLALIEHLDFSQDNADIIVTLTDGSKWRVEVSALPAELFLPLLETDLPTEPAPEHATLTNPKPGRAQTQAKPKNSKGRK